MQLAVVVLRWSCSRQTTKLRLHVEQQFQVMCIEVVEQIALRRFDDVAAVGVRVNGMRVRVMMVMEIVRVTAAALTTGAQDTLKGRSSAAGYLTFTLAQCPVLGRLGQSVWGWGVKTFAAGEVSKCGRYEGMCR